VVDSVDVDGVVILVDPIDDPIRSDTGGVPTGELSFERVPYAKRIGDESS